MLTFNLFVEVRDVIPCTQHKMRVSRPDMVRRQNWAIFLRVCVNHFEYWFPTKLSCLTARQNESCPLEEIFHIWMRRNDTNMDQIPVKFLKEAARVLAYSLAKMISLSVKLSFFPEKCKTARLKQLFKKDSKTDPKN